MARSPPLYVGTAGWTIPAAVSASFSGQGTHLERYARELHATEINSTFRKHHARSTFERWAQSVPASFRFSVKLPEAVTHGQASRERTETLTRFLAEIEGLGKKLGALLVQFPPKHVYEGRGAAAFFDGLRSRTAVDIACEPRHESWNSAAASKLFVRYCIGRVAADPPRWPGGDLPGGWDELAYYRLHGTPRVFYSNYDEPRLGAIREAVQTSVARGARTWCMFDNTAAGCALGNALAVAK